MSVAICLEPLNAMRLRLGTYLASRKAHLTMKMRSIRTRRATSSRWSRLRIPPAVLIGVVAFAMRAFFGYATFGGVDLKNAMTMADAIVDGRLSSFHFPYVPVVVPAILWFAGMMERLVSLPPAVFYKLVPVAFDSALAVLVYAVCKKRDERYAFHAGLLYAFCPLAILINDFHVQWDSVALFFLFGSFAIGQNHAWNTKSALASAFLFSLSVLTKPYTLVFGPFLVPPWPVLRQSRGGLRSLAVLVATSVGLLGLALLLLHKFGFHLPQVMHRITTYTKDGVQVFGLPRLSGYLSGFRDRLFVIPPILLLLGPYYRGAINRFHVAFFVFAACLATTGICAQYLIWPIVPLLVLGRLRLASIYSLTVTLVLTAYYLCPLVASEHGAMFATLRSLTWAMPSPISWIRTLPFARSLIVTCNLLCPVLAACVLLWEVRRRILRCPTDLAESWSWSRWTVAGRLSFFLSAVGLFWVARTHSWAPVGFWLILGLLVTWTLEMRTSSHVDPQHSPLRIATSSYFRFLLVTAAAFLIVFGYVAWGSHLARIRQGHYPAHASLYAIVNNAGQYQLGSWFSFPMLLILEALVSFVAFLRLKPAESLAEAPADLATVVYERRALG